MIKSVRHIGIIVKDLRKSIEFFENILQLQQWETDIEYGPHIDGIIGIENVKIEWIKLKTSDDFIIELLQYHSHPEINSVNVPQIGAAHIALTVSDINKLYNTITTLGYRCCKPQLSLDKKAKALYCYGPDGITLELVEEQV